MTIVHAKVLAKAYKLALEDFKAAALHPPEIDDEDFFALKIMAKRVLEFDPNHNVSLIILSEIYIEEGKHDKAITLMEKAIDQGGISDDEKCSYGLALFALNKYDEASNMLSQIADRLPLDDFIATIAAYSFYKIGKHTQAREFYTRAIQMGAKEEPYGRLYLNEMEDKGLYSSKIHVPELTR